MRFRPQLESLERRDAPASGITDGIAWQIVGPVPYGVTAAQEQSALVGAIDAWAKAAPIHLPGTLVLNTRAGYAPPEARQGWWVGEHGLEIDLTTLRPYSVGSPPANPNVGPFSITTTLEHGIGAVLGIREVPLSDVKDLNAIMGPFYSYLRPAALTPYDIAAARAIFGPLQPVSNPPATPPVSQPPAASQPITPPIVPPLPHAQGARPRD